jgi:hypothetical protein
MVRHGAGACVITGNALLAPESARSVLGEISRITDWRVREVLAAEVVKDRAERRRTLRYRLVAERGGEAREVTWYAKQYRGSKGERVWRVLRHLQAQSSRNFTIAEPIAYLPKPKLLIMEALEGPTLASALGGTLANALGAEALERPEQIHTMLERTGGALAAVHGVPLPSDGWSLKAHGPREEIGVLEDARGRASASGPRREWQTRFLQACSVVESELTYEETGRSGSLLHRDFHPGQIVLRQDAIGVLDWDEAAVGEPELDLGNLEAHLMLVDFQRCGVIRDAPQRIAAVRAGYRSAREVDPGRLATYTRATLLRLATLDRLAAPRLSVLDWRALASALTEASIGIRSAV